MNIGVVGVGNIAEKAYLPTYAKNQGEIDFYFATRNKRNQKKESMIDMDLNIFMTRSMN